MEKANLPIENAREPDEQARMSQDEKTLAPPMDQHKQRKSNKTVAKVALASEKAVTQSSVDALSQPAPGATHRQRMLWLQKRRSSGLWVQCDDCQRWRYLPDVLDSHELPPKWYCKFNPDSNFADCSISEAPLHICEEEDLIHSEYSAGSLVWARMHGWPWWPAMVDDCPDTEQFYWLDGFSDIPTHYNVVFFDTSDVTRGWIAPEQLKPYSSYKNKFKYLLKDKKFKKRIEAAVRQADDAEMLPLQNRLAKYSFIARYPGAINNPKKININDLKRFQKQLKRKYNIDFSNEIEYNSDDDAEREQFNYTHNNMVLLGTPKKSKAVGKIITQVDEEFLDGGSNKSDICIDETLAKQIETKNRNEVPKSFKENISVQVKSTEPSALFGSFDNDTSNTYVPESGNETVSTADTETTNRIQDRVVSPSSGDFDF